MDRAAVIYVHGLWMPGAEGWLLGRRLEAERDCRFHVFRYAAVRQPMSEIVTALRDRIASIDAERIHLLGHSLGGIVILRCLERYPPRRPGRALFLGTPLLGSRAARNLVRLRFGRALLGATAAAELLAAHERPWPGGRELGIIAGTRALSLGRLLLKFDEANDGTVGVSETRLPGARAHLCLPVSHTGMLWSARVARETGSFLQHGCFGA